MSRVLHVARETLESQEKLGFALIQQGGPTTVDSFFGLAGCNQPTNNSNRGCGLGPKKTYSHFALEAWTSGNQLAWDQIQTDLPETAPVRLGNIGYNGAATYYVPSSVLSEAYGAEGISLDFYREYNISWNDPSRYFTSPVSIDSSRLLPCSQTTLVRASDMMTIYPELTGDIEGVESTDGGIVAKCFDQHFWYAPTCRSNASTCIVMCLRRTSVHSHASPGIGRCHDGSNWANRLDLQGYRVMPAEADWWFGMGN